MDGISKVPCTMEPSGCTDLRDSCALHVGLYSASFCGIQSCVSLASRAVTSNQLLN